MTPDTEIAFAPGFWRTLVFAVLRRPSLWWTALVQANEFALPGWWRRKPFVPVPDAKYMQFRFETQYGTTGTPEPHHVVEYLAWCREMRDLTSGAA